MSASSDMPTKQLFWLFLILLLSSVIKTSVTTVDGADKSNKGRTAKNLLF